jgi:membrane-associated phospholipid phosphatase
LREDLSSPLGCDEKMTVVFRSTRWSGRMTSHLVRYRRLDLVLMIAGAAVLISSALLARRGVYQWEIVVFSAINDLPGNVARLLWILNQYGTAVTIPVATVVALLFRKWTLALSLAISGVGVYLLAKVIKEFVERGRPDELLEGVVERETFAPGSLGYPSGHAAVAWTITLLIAPYVRRGWQIAALLIAIVVPFIRMYVGAHLPLDLVGGAALGVAIASATNLLVGVPRPRRPEDEHLTRDDQDAIATDS